MESLVWSARPTLRKGVLVCAFYGWNDGGEAATLSALFLRQQLGATQFCELDPDEFYDFQEVRPVVSLGDDEHRRLAWPENSFAWAPLPSGNDIAVMVGIEPQNRWKLYSRSIVEVAKESGAELVVTLGGFLADTPHTRPVPVTGSADGDIADQLGLAPSQYEGPTGIVGVVHDACRDAGIASASLWAAVPHYISVSPNPKAALALLSRLALLLETSFDTTKLSQDAVQFEREVSHAVSADEKISRYVRELESRSDERADDDADEESPPLLASGDDIAAQIERYLAEREESSDDS
ncbi:MAG TPA: PAC2 family protein [Gaiellales bacterium]|jgi:proteasome assembly chaperone (PAC2) family protein